MKVLKKPKNPKAGPSLGMFKKSITAQQTTNKSPSKFQLPNQSLEKKKSC
jgi:hypothetical protein